MKAAIHQLITSVHGEELFVWLRRRTNFIRRLIPRELRHRIGAFGRFIPPPARYPHNDSYVVTRDHTTFRINRSDYVQWRLFYGVRDNALKTAIDLVTNRCVVLDIGANFGAFSLRLANHAKRNGMDVFVHAFEPNTHAQQLFKDNVNLNPVLAPHLKLHPFGLGAAPEERSLIVPGGNSGAARIVRGSNETASLVGVRVLDNLDLELDGRKITFIKLIAGGFEGEIFAGAWRTIEKHRPTIFFEVTARWYAEHGTSLEAITSRLTSNGYHLYAEYRNDITAFDPGFFRKVDQYYILARPSS